MKKLLLACVIAVSLPAVGMAKTPTKAPTKTTSAVLPFPGIEKSLPANYKGVDGLAFGLAAERKFGKRKKGEFETEDAFRQKGMMVLGTGDAPYGDLEYAIRVDGPERFKVSYDAEKEAFLVARDGYTFCSENMVSRDPQNRVLGGFDDYIFCGIGEKTVHGSERTRFSSGYAFTVYTTKGSKYSLALDGDDAMFKDFTGSIWRKEELIPVPIEKAKAIGRDGIGILFVGKVTDARLIAGRGVVNYPTPGYPYYFMISDKGIPFELKRIVYFVKKTGEILQVKQMEPVADPAAAPAEESTPEAPATSDGTPSPFDEVNAGLKYKL